MAEVDTVTMMRLIADDDLASPEEHVIALRKGAEEIERMRAALIPFARIWAMNDGFNPHPDQGVREYAAGAWPTMGDAKRAYDLVWAHRKPGL